MDTIARIALMRERERDHGLIIFQGEEWIDLPRYLSILKDSCLQRRPSLAIVNATSRFETRWKARRSIGSLSFFIWIRLSLNAFSTIDRIRTKAACLYLYSLSSFGLRMESQDWQWPCPKSNWLSKAHARTSANSSVTLRLFAFSEMSTSTTRHYVFSRLGINEISTFGGCRSFRYDEWFSIIEILHSRSNGHCHREK